MGVLELTALPSTKEEHWVPTVQETDALLVGGGDPLYLCYWIPAVSDQRSAISRPN
jgi:dipeptidase E